MKKLRIADDLNLPMEAVTEKIAFLGRTGTGKTYAAMKFAELMLEAGAQVIALDFVGKWYGLRVPGLGEPFAIPVFGGLNGDYPLEATAGRLVADIIVDRGISCVLDVSQFIRSEQVRFCYDFATQFFQRKKSVSSACHLFIEECQECLPQNPEANEAPMLGAFQRIWKLGRNFGIGGSLITQRPQEVNKKALNMSGTLVVFQMTGPQERKTVKEWVSSQGVNEDIVEVLPRLGKGTPHVWSVAFDTPISKTVTILPKRSADVSATPTVNSSVRKETPLTPIDVPALQEAMAATIEKSKSEDPKELRKQIVRMTAELENAKRIKTVDAAFHVQIEALEVERKQLLDENRKLEQEIDFARSTVVKIRELIDPVKWADSTVVAYKTTSGETHRTIGDIVKLDLADIRRESQYNRSRDNDSAANVPIVKLNRIPDAWDLDQNQKETIDRSVRRRSVDTVKLPEGERKILIAIAQTAGGATKEQVGIMCDYKRSSRDAYVARLSTKGYVTSGNGMLTATASGVKALGDYYEPLPTGHELLQYWLVRLPEGESLILDIVARSYPKPIDRDIIGAKTNYKRSSRDAYLARLSTRRLVTSDRSGVVASDMLFD